ncbi:MAG: toxic anion resistance protein [Rhodospirillales bacterium]|nr:toxic anion resistance protein [Rhodospirillales bacterium]
MSTDDKNTLTTTALFAAASGTIQRGKLNRDIVDYGTAVGDTKIKMDRLIESLDSKDLNSVTTFAKEPSQVLGDVADGVIKEVQNSGSFLAPFDEFKQAIANFDFDTLSEMAADFSGSVTRKLKIASYNPVFRFIVNLFSGNNDTSMAEIRAEIDKSMLQLGEVMASLEEASDNIPGIVTRLDTLRDTLTEAYSDYGLYIGAALEKLRRMEEDEIPALQAEVQAGSLLKQEELQSAYMTMTILNKKITNMDNFHKQSLLNLARIRDLKKAVGMSKLNLDEKLTVSEGEWKGVIATNAVATEVSEIVDTIADTDAFSRKIREQGVKVAAMIQDKVTQAFEVGTVDAVRMVELLKNKATDANKEAEYLSDFNRRQKAARAELDAAGRELLAASANLHVPLSNTEVEQAKKEVAMLTKIPANTLDVEVTDEQEKQPVPVVRPPEVK